MTKRADRTMDGDAPKPLSCEEVRDMIPSYALGDAVASERDPVARHLSGCRACAEEARFVARIRAIRLEPPSDLPERVMARLPAPAASSEVERPVRPAWSASRWSLAAAALLVLALGVGVVWSGNETPGSEGMMATLVWDEDDNGDPSDEWMVAGAPVWDALPDDVLLTLLEDEES